MLIACFPFLFIHTHTAVCTLHLSHYTWPDRRWFVILWLWIRHIEDKEILIVINFLCFYLFSPGGLLNQDPLLNDNVGDEESSELQEVVIDKQPQVDG